MPSSESSCRHPDVRKFDGVRTCLSCGVAVFKRIKTQPADTKLLPDASETGDAASSYKYKDLNYELGQEIRLLIVQPGEESEPIRCEIIHVNLEDDPDYTAVSYTWADESGDDSKSRSVQCLNGTEIPVTLNCEAALRQLRKPGLKQYLWIDAICINQSNTRERNHQVGLMDQIYSKASKVYICINDPVHDHQQALDWLGQTDDSAIDNISLRASVKKLLSLRWFTRVWVIQEVALSNSAFLIVNNARIFLSPDVLERLRSYCRSQGLQVPGPLRWSPGSRQKHDLFTCLDASRSCFSKDPRDKIYAILSLVEPEFRKLIPINYHEDFRWTSVTFFVAAAVFYKNLELLSHCTFMSGTNELTSWVPDLMLPMTATKPIDQFAMQQDSLIWKSKPSVHIADERLKGFYTGMTGDPGSSDVQFLPRDVPAYMAPRLQVRAHLIDCINEHIFQVRDSKWAEDISYDLKFLRMHKWILQLFRRPPRQITHPSESWMTAERSALKECLLDYKEFLEMQNSPVISAIPLTGFPSMEDTDSYPYPNPSTTNDRLRSFQTTPYNLSDLALFINAKKKWKSKFLFESAFSVGFASGHARSGDHIFAIDGAKAPFILRYVGKNKYRIVEDCYLWAALELDYWNPGTYKGRWSNGNHGLRAHQTRMIELL